MSELELRNSHNNCIFGGPERCEMFRSNRGVVLTDLRCGASTAKLRRNVETITQKGIHFVR